MFLEKYCKESTFRLAVLNDLQNPLIITQLRALGLFGKILTGPWMSIFYKNEEKRKHIDMLCRMLRTLFKLYWIKYQILFVHFFIHSFLKVPVMKLCIESISSFITNPRSLLEARMDCFMNELDASDGILKSLRNCDCDEVFLKIVQSLAGDSEMC
ncbi:hypothetical protein Btru_072027 [Bulinus truncatus]|nr:hypothetical protein Btru_072027 [Bulinus truncatus]